VGFRNVGIAFFIWLSVFNLFVVSVFWSFMADIYTKIQSRRLFGLISAGGSAGAMIGPFFASRIVVPVGFENILPISACVLLVAVACISRLKNWVLSEHTNDADKTMASNRSLGGTWWNGIASVFRERYLVWMAIGSVIASLMGTALYIFTAQLVSEAIPTTDERVQFFANIDWITNSAAFLLQLLVVRHSVERLGLAITLTIMPIVSIIGFAILANNPLLLVVAALTIARRAIGFGLTKPSTDMLYSVVPDEQKYKSKNFIDTAIYRGGDLFGAWTVRGLQGLGLGIAGIALVMVPVGLIWVALAILLGREYKRRDADTATHS
ncbi:MAG: MFS transporter, partial [Pseudomonadota bacterium]